MVLAMELRRGASAPPRPLISLVLGMLAALLTYIIAVKRPEGSDIVLFHRAPAAILHGESPHTALPGLPALVLVEIISTSVDGGAALRRAFEGARIDLLEALEISSAHQGGDPLPMSRDRDPLVPEPYAVDQLTVIFLAVMLVWAALDLYGRWKK